MAVRMAARKLRRRLCGSFALPGAGRRLRFAADLGEDRLGDPDGRQRGMRADAIGTHATSGGISLRGASMPGIGPGKPCPARTSIRAFFSAAEETIPAADIRKGRPAKPL